LISDGEGNWEAANGRTVASRTAGKSWFDDEVSSSNPGRIMA